MNLYEIDYLKKMSALLQEAFKLKKYKAMPKALAVFCFILMTPIVAASFLVTAFFSFFAFAFAVISSPVKYLHEIVHVEGKEVKHATQAIVYLISWPFVFFLYALMSFLMLLLLPTYALLSFLCYVWSLGGFKFHLFPNQADDISIEVKGTYRFLPIVFLIVGGIILVLIPIIHGIICFGELYEYYMERYFAQIFFIGVYPKYVALHTAFATFYSLLGCVRHPKAKAVDPAEADLEF